MAKGTKPVKLFLLMMIVSLIICVLSITIGELYFQGTEFVDIYCAIGTVSMFLFLINFGIAEVLIRAKLRTE